MVELALNVGTFACLSFGMLGAMFLVVLAADEA